MSMKKTIIIAVLMMTAFVAQAQKVKFYSPAFEDGVRYHCGLGESADVQQVHVDTIKSLDLSGLDITDIRDVTYLTSVERLDLSSNKIVDVSPLLSLESLRELNLSHNRLESVDILAFVEADSLEVNVSRNYISDFSYFYTPTPCYFTFLGMDMQREKDAPYFSIYQLYADINDEGKPVVAYRGRSNMTGLSLECGSSGFTVELDGATHQVAITQNLDGPSLVTLSNGETEKTTYVVPPTNHSVEAGKTVTLTTGLPDDYDLVEAYADNGTVEIIDNTIQYTATDTASPDVIWFFYSQGDTYKGRSCFFINGGSTDIPDVKVVDDDSPATVYEPSGIVVSRNGLSDGNVKKGLKIIRYSNGTVKKVVIK